MTVKLILTLTLLSVSFTPAHAIMRALNTAATGMAGSKHHAATFSLVAQATLSITPLDDDIPQAGQASSQPRSSVMLGSEGHLVVQRKSGPKPIIRLNRIQGTSQFSIVTSGPASQIKNLNDSSSLARHS